MYVLFALLIIYQKHRIDFFTTYIQQRRGAIFFRLTTTDMSFEIHTTTVVEKDIYIYIYHLGEWWDLRGKISTRRLGP